MAGFAYALAGVRKKAEAYAKLKEAGLDHVTRGVFSFRTTDAGPNGGPCGLLGGPVRSDEDRVSTGDPGSLRWVKVVGHEAWVGMDPSARPTPHELELVDQRGGHPIRLDDGNDWLVPVGRLFNGQAALPQVITLDDEGVPKAKVTDPFKDLWDTACKLYDECNAEPNDPAEYRWLRRTDSGWSFNITNCYELVAELLGINYSLGRVELSMLELLTVDNLIDVLTAVLDWPSLEAIQKKTGVGT